MKNIPLHLMNAEERAAELWRREKANCGRALRKQARDDAKLALVELVSAAETVVAAWESKELAPAVRRLAAAVEEYKEAKA